MANVAAYAQAAMLNILLNGAAVTQPTKWGVGLSLGSPTSVSGSEITTGSGYARQTVGFDSAASPGTLSCTNTVAATWGPFSSTCSISGLQIWDTVLSLNSGDMLWYGLLATVRTLLAGDYVILASGALTISLT